MYPQESITVFHWVRSYLLPPIGGSMGGFGVSYSLESLGAKLMISAVCIQTVRTIGFLLILAVGYDFSLSLDLEGC